MPVTKLIYSNPPPTDINVNIGLEFKKMVEELRERYALLIRQAEAHEIGHAQEYQKLAQELEAFQENHAFLLVKDNVCIKPESVVANTPIPLRLPIQGVRFSVNGVRLVHRVTPMMVRHQSHTEAIEDADITLVDDGEAAEDF